MTAQAALQLFEVNTTQLWDQGLSACVQLFIELQDFANINPTFTEIYDEYARFSRALEDLADLASDFVHQAREIRNTLRQLGTQTPVALAQRNLDRLVRRCSNMDTESNKLAESFGDVKEGLLKIGEKMNRFLIRENTSIEMTEKVRRLVELVANGVEKISEISGLLAVGSWLGGLLKKKEKALSDNIARRRENHSQAQNLQSRISTTHTAVADQKTYLLYTSSRLKNLKTILEDFKLDAGQAAGSWAIQGQELQIVLDRWRDLAIEMRDVAKMVESHSARL
ncbi:hypothetical protein BC938DRAFT_483410 [Jimgerdemannia flammicorona]|uniref:Uncharacterized protein n=1 Tax=Jimgerdemannia flammicorona TaxID=994334 RepID=A0A433QVU7_9FUNG|nr:hypothetical protein BC938DRAFT_483410 [Jimgerdemannia flammicorona]